jgi:hypothetical protein
MTLQLLKFIGNSILDDEFSIDVFTSTCKKRASKCNIHAEHQVKQKKEEDKTLLTCYKEVHALYNFALLNPLILLRNVQSDCSVVTGFLFPRIKWPGREADHSPPSRTKIKDDWCRPQPCTPSCHAQGQGSLLLRYSYGYCLVVL